MNSFIIKKVKKKKYVVKPSMPVVIIIFILGFLALGASGYFGLKSKTLLDTGLHATGSVVRIDEHLKERTSKHPARMMYASIVEFKDSTGKTISFKTAGQSSSPPHTIGETVEVVYTPDDPTGSATVNSLFYMWFMPGILLLVGIVLVFGGFKQLGMLRAEQERPVTTL